MKRTDIRWYHWPMTYENWGAAPWYVILRRLPFWFLLQTGLVLTWLGTLGCYGRRAARRFWVEN